MTAIANRKFVVILVVMMTFNLWLNLFGYLIYSVYEMAEYYLEILVRNLFDVGHHDSELIVFYFFFLLAFGGLARLWFLTPRIYRYFCALTTEYTRQFAEFWHTLAIVEKIKLSLTYMMTGSGFLFFLFM